MSRFAPIRDDVAATRTPGARGAASVGAVVGVSIAIGIVAVAGYLLYTKISALEQQVVDLDRHVDETERRLMDAEARARAADRAAQEAELRATEADQRAADAERRAETAEQQAGVAHTTAEEAARARTTAEEARAAAEAASQQAEREAEEARAAREAAIAEAEAARAEAQRIRAQREAELNRLHEALNKIVETRRTAIGVVMNLGSDRIEFEFDKSDLRQQERELLARIAGVLIASADHGYAIQVFGHTDDVGTEEYNQGLSELRAQAVRDYLVEAGVDPKVITTTGLGKSMPLVDGTDELSRARNRRVAIGIVDTLISYGRER